MNRPECKLISTEGITSNLYQWLQKRAEEYESKYLLAHADDGVIWGYFKETGNQRELITADTIFTDVFPKLARLRLLTLQQCRLFSKTAEVMLWFTGADREADESWKARFIQDKGLIENEDYLPEAQMLWGTQKDDAKEEFTLISDGSQGLRHAAPLKDIPFSSNPEKLYRPIRLLVRHYIDYDDDGLARIALSRLVDLTTDYSTKEH